MTAITGAKKPHPSTLPFACKPKRELRHVMLCRSDFPKDQKYQFPNRDHNRGSLSAFMRIWSGYRPCQSNYDFFFLQRHMEYKYLSSSFISNFIHPCIYTCIYLQDILENPNLSIWISTPRDPPGAVLLIPVAVCVHGFVPIKSSCLRYLVW